MFTLLYFFNMTSKRLKTKDVNSFGETSTQDAKKSNSINNDENIVKNDSEFILCPIQHPFLNHLILDSVFQYCSNSSLGNCRSVCSLWSSVAATTLRKRSIKTEFYTAKDFEKFTSTVKTSTEYDFPFKNFKFHWETCKTVNNPTLRHCFHVCKDLIEELYLPLDYEYQDVDDKLTVIPAINLPVMEKLTKFTLDMQHAVPELLEVYVSGQNNRPETWSKKYLEPLFCSMPNLKSFTFINRIAGQVHEIQPHTKCLTEFVTQLLQKKIESLTLSVLVSDTNLRLMTGLRLKFLSVNFYNSPISSDVFTEFMRSQKDTLEHLEIEESTEFNTNFEIKFPCMPQLKVLHITVANSLDSLYAPISYNDNFPKLETFVYNRLCQNSSRHWYENRCTTVKEAKIYFDQLPSHLLMYSMCLSFSALKKLEVFCSGGCQHIFQNLDSLEELTLLGCHLSDEDIDFVLTGLRFTDDSEILELPFEKRPRPSIGLMHRLRCLTLVGHTGPKRNANGKAPRLDCTDFSGYNAFLKMESLHTLQIGPCKISEQCYKDMSDKFLVIPLSKQYLTANCNPRMKS